MANGANVIRDLFIRLGVQVDPKAKNDVARFNKGIGAAKDALEQTAKAAVRAGAALVGFVSAGVTAATALAVSNGRAAEEVERHAAALQLTRQEYQALTATFERFDGDASDVRDALGTITDKAQDLIDGTQSVVDDFKLIGIGVDEVKGKRPIELFEALADRVAGATDRNKALTAVVRLLGDDLGAKLNPLLMQGSAGLRAMAEEAHALGLVMTDEQLAAQKAVAVEWRRSTSLVRGLRNEIATQLAPTVVGLLKSWNEWVQVNRQLITKRIEDGFRFLRASILAADQAARLVGGWDTVFVGVATGTGLLLLLANLGKVKTAFFAIRTIVTAVGAVFGTVAAAIGVSTGTVVAVVAGLVAGLVLLGLVVQDVWVYWQGGESLLGRVLDRLEALIPAFTNVRRLLSVVGDGIAVSTRNMWEFAAAIVRGLAPALRLLEPPLGFLRDALKEIRVLWSQINQIAGGGIDAFTNILQGAITTGNVKGTQTAAGIESTVSAAVGAVVDRILGTGGGGGGSVTNATVNQTNNFASAGTEAVERLDAALRAGGLSVAGGPR